MVECVATIGRGLRRFTTLIAIISMMALTIPVAADPFPTSIDLPNGISPEGIAIGGNDFYTGSLVTGEIYKGSIRTGDGDFINDAADFATPRMAVGMDHDSRANALWVAGGLFGQGYVYDASSGDTISVLQLTTAEATFVNDVVVTRGFAYFTDSFQPVFYRVPLDSRGLPAGSPEAVALTGDFEFIGDGAFNSNGIDATPNGRDLIIVNSTTGALYKVHPRTGHATLIDLGGDSVPSGDGILLDGRTLYVVQNFFNQIAVVHLSHGLTQGEVAAPITSPDFMIPTTIAEFGPLLYAVNARFDVAPPGVPSPDVEFSIVGVPK